MASIEERPSTKRWTADEVWRMVEVGLLDEDDRYELIDGELLAVTPQGEGHAGPTTELLERLVIAYAGSGFNVRCQAPIGGIRDWIPEPDLAVVPRGPRATAPTPSEALLLVEVALISHVRDRRKSRVYGAHGAAEYWLVDLVRREVLVHTGPLASGAWGRVTRRVAGDRLALPGIEAVVEVTEIIGEGERQPATTDAERGDETDAR